MLQYIKKKINENNVNTDDDFDDSELIVECAHLFQELSDLSVEGTEADSERKMIIDIPLEDDIELDSIEINIGDGRLTDIPMDAAVQESDRTEMKTFDDFYQEACVSVVKLQRETDEAHADRITKVANRNYTQYKNQIVQEGLFGFNKIHINDPIVPSVVTANFGPLSPDKPGQNYYVKLDVLFEVDKKKKLLKKQLETVNVVINEDRFVELSTYAFELFNKKHPEEMKGVKSIWDVLTPKKLLVPKDPIDYLILYIQFECSFRINGDYKYILTWSRSIKPVKNGVKADIEAITDKSAISRMMHKKDYIQEEYELSRPSRFSKTYQEGFISNVINKLNNKYDADQLLTTMKRVENRTKTKLPEEYKKYMIDSVAGKYTEIVKNNKYAYVKLYWDKSKLNRYNIEANLIDIIKNKSINDHFYIGYIECYDDKSKDDIETPIYIHTNGRLYTKFFSKNHETLEPIESGYSDIYNTLKHMNSIKMKNVQKTDLTTNVDVYWCCGEADHVYNNIPLFLNTTNDVTLYEYCYYKSQIYMIRDSSSDYFGEALRGYDDEHTDALHDILNRKFPNEVPSWESPTDVFDYIKLKSIYTTKGDTICEFKTVFGNNIVGISLESGQITVNGEAFNEPYIQEAIDFGSDSTPEPSVELASPDNVDQTNPDTVDTTTNEDTTPVDPNDVSDAIVDKVANDNEVTGDGQDIPPTDEPPIDEGDDITDIPVDGDGAGDTVDIDDTEQQLNDLNDMGNTEAEVDGEGSLTVDVDNMTIDELLSQGSDKLKSMTINQLKEFLSDENNMEQIQEAFFFSNKNINNKLDIELRKTLGILNDSDMELDDILTSFRKQGKILNKVLSKAIKNKKVYSTEEIDSLNKLNKCLITTLNAIKTEKDDKYDLTVKRLIKAFVSASAIVGKIIESKKSKPEGVEDNE